MLHEERIDVDESSGPELLAEYETMLAEILRQRRYELYLQGLRWSDLRRFGQPVKYAFRPVPPAECDRNNNAPC